MGQDDKITPLEVRVPSDPTKRTGGTRVIIDVSADDEAPANVQTMPTTILRRWEMILSLTMFAMTSAVQFEIIDLYGKNVKLAFWFITVLSQIGLIFGRPLLVRGTKQPIKITSENTPIPQVDGHNKEK